MKKADACESKKYNSNQISVLLIGDDDVVIRTSGLLWDSLPRFGEIRGVKLVPLSAVPFVDPTPFNLLFFHLSHSTNVPAELKALNDLREKSCKHSGEAVCVLVVPEGSPDFSDSAADFVLTQPVTAETVEEVLSRCSFLSEQSQNGRSCLTIANSAEGQKPDTEATDHQAEPIMHEQESRAESAALLEDVPTAELSDGDLQAFLHSKKEQKRRTQIRECCDRLQDLLPFIRSRTDTASTLELTVMYMAYIRQRLPQEILDEVVKALEQNGPESWFKPTKAPKKRRTCTARNKPADASTQEPTCGSFADDFIAAHVLGRHIQPKVDGIQHSSTVLMNQPFDPPPDPGPALSPSVGPVQASGPFSHTFLMTQAYSEPAAIDPPAPPVFWNQACGPVTANQNFVPQMVHNPSTARAMIVEESSLPPVQTLLVYPQLLPPVGLDPGYPLMAQSFAPLRSLNDLCPLEVTASLPSSGAATPRGVSDYMPITTVLWEDQILSEILYDSAPSLPPSSSSSHFTISSAPEPTFSSSLSGPSQWDFGCENGPVYPLQSYPLEGLHSPQNALQVLAQSTPDPESGSHFLGEASTAKLYGQHYTGATELQIN